MSFNCRNHGKVEPKIRNKGPHIGAYCPICDAWIKWIPKSEAPPNHPTEVTTGPQIRVDEPPYNYDEECPFEPNS